MKRTITIALITLLTALSAHAAMSNSRLRKEARFLTDKMAYELNLTNAQYDDVYEINYDFIASVRYILDDVARGYDWARKDYNNRLHLRNTDLRYVLSRSQYHRFEGLDYFHRPLYVDAGSWAFRIYRIYANHNHFYYPKPHHYNSYKGKPRPHYVTKPHKPTVKPAPRPEVKPNKPAPRPNKPGNNVKPGKPDNHNNPRSSGKSSSRRSANSDKASSR